MHLHRQTGQATTEYVAIVAVVAIVFGAATAVAAPWLPRRVASAIRLGICKVGADICDARDAAARDLDPCVLTRTDHRRRTGASLLVVRVGGTQEYAIERRSDGSYRLSANDGQDVGATTGAGLRLGPAVSIGPDGVASVAWTSGKAWELPDAHALRDLLSKVNNGYDLSSGFTDVAPAIPAPTTRFTRAGAEAVGSLALELTSEQAGTRPASESVQLRAALGRETGEDGTTVAFDVEGASDGPLARLVPALARGGHLLAEWHTGRRPSLTLRTATATGRRSTEVVARLPLDDPADRAAAARYVLAALPDPAARLAGRDLATRLAARGTVQRFTYAETNDDHGFNVELKMIAALGAERSRHITTRRLVGADVLTPDGTLARADCLGLDAA